MRGRKRFERTEKIWDLYNEGVSRHEIAEKFGVSLQSVSAAITRGRQHGRVPPRKPLSPKYHIMKMTYASGVKIGRLSDVTSSLTSEQVDWLVFEASKVGCSSIAEYITEVVRDEYERQHTTAD